MGEAHAAKARGAGPRSRSATGERKRKQILDASVRVFGTGGAGAVTHRAVAKVAQVPLGSTTYYFVDRDDLLVAPPQLDAQEAGQRRLPGSAFPQKYNSHPWDRMRRHTTVSRVVNRPIWLAR